MASTNKYNNSGNGNGNSTNLGHVQLAKTEGINKKDFKLG